MEVRRNKVGWQKKNETGICKSTSSGTKAQVYTALKPGEMERSKRKTEKL